VKLLHILFVGVIVSILGGTLFGFFLLYLPKFLDSEAWQVVFFMIYIALTMYFSFQTTEKYGNILKFSWLGVWMFFCFQLIGVVWLNIPLDLLSW